MNIFKVIIHNDLEYHFRIAIKAFDSNSIINCSEIENNYFVKTNISIIDLQSLTSVKKVINITEQQSFYDTEYYN